MAGKGQNNSYEYTSDKQVWADVIKDFAEMFKPVVDSFVKEKKRYIQEVIAPPPKIANGAFHPSRFLGRSFRARSIPRIRSRDTSAKSVPLGKYHRIKPLTFSFAPRSDDVYG
jgi:hypothetical protein